MAAFLLLFFNRGENRKEKKRYVTTYCSRFSGLTVFVIGGRFVVMKLAIRHPSGCFCGCC